MSIYFLCVKLCKFNVLHNPSSSQQYDRPTIASGVILNPNMLRENIALMKVHNLQLGQSH